MLLKSQHSGVASRGTHLIRILMTILVTGGAGFIGANFVLDWLAASNEAVINLDKLTYAGNPETLASLQGDARHQLVQGDIGDAALVSRLLAEHQPRAVVNFAAESHVDRSIHGPGEFIETNIVGTFRLLESVRGYWSGLPDSDIREQGLAPTGGKKAPGLQAFASRGSLPLHTQTGSVGGEYGQDAGVAVQLVAGNFSGGEKTNQRHIA